MKIWVAVFALVAIASTAAEDDEQEGLVSAQELDQFHSKVTKGLDFLRGVFKKLEARNFPGINIPSVTGEGLQMSVTLSNVKISGPSDFYIAQNDPIYEDQAVKTTVWLTQVYVNGQYSCSGTHNGKRFSGQGNFEVLMPMTQIHARAGLVKRNGVVFVDEMDLSHRVHEVKFWSDGLSGEGMDNEQINERVTEYLFAVATNYNEFVTNAAKKGLKLIANAFMTGQGLLGLLMKMQQYTQIVARFG